VYLNNLYRHLKAMGLQVEYVPGWSTRGSETFAPGGVLAHWTAGPRGSVTRPSLNICVNGRSGLPGPLCNVYGDRRGVAVIVAAGRANHGGPGIYRGKSGNSRWAGIEMEAADNSDWTPQQRLAYPLMCAGILNAINEKGLGPADHRDVAGHYEYALPAGRKIDPRGYTMDMLREQTRLALAGQLGHPKPVDVPNSSLTVTTPTPTTPKDDEMTPQQMQELKDYIADQVKTGLQYALVGYDDASLKKVLHEARTGAQSGYSNSVLIKGDVAKILAGQAELTRVITEAIAKGDLTPEQVQVLADAAREGAEAGTQRVFEKGLNIEASITANDDEPQEG